MSKSKKVTVSKQQLAETGEELEVVGEIAEVEGAIEVEEGVENLEAAKVIGDDRRAADGRGIQRPDPRGRCGDRV